MVIRFALDASVLSQIRAFMPVFALFGGQRVFVGLRTLCMPNVYISQTADILRENPIPLREPHAHKARFRAFYEENKRK
jgi:hypothetical protein